MTAAITHAFINLVPDDPDAALAGETLPSHWNASHLISGVIDAANLPPARELLAADRTYYVRTDGNDSNTGLVNNAGGAFLTPAAAFAAAAALDSLTFNVTIRFNDGTRTTQFLPKPLLGSGTLFLVGNSATPANCVISTTGVDAISCDFSSGGKIDIEGFKVTTTGVSTRGLSVYNLSIVNFRNIDFGACQESHFICAGGAPYILAGDYTVSGDAIYHVYAFTGFIEFYFNTVTITGTPALSGAWAYASVTGSISTYGTTFSGSPTGPRYLADTNGVIQTFAEGPNYFPGDSAGSTNTGGQYL